MKNFNNIFCLLMLVIFAMSGCRKDGDEIIDGSSMTTINIPVELVHATFDGLVVDEFGEVIEGAEIIIGDQIGFTNTIGYYRIKARVNLNGTKIHVKKSGFVDAYANVVPKEDEVNTVGIKLRTRNITSSTSSSNPERIVFEGGHTIEFLPNSFLNLQGQNYNGNVNVYAFYFDATSNAFSEFVPGDMYGQRLANQEIIIKSDGILYLEIFGEGGEELSLSEPAEIRIESMENGVFEDIEIEIHSWVLDKETAIWIEDSPIEKVNGSYVLRQTELGFINLGSHAEFFSAEYSFTSDDSNRSYPYRIIDQQGRYITGGVMNDPFSIKGKFPQDEEMQVIFSSLCNDDQFILMINSSGVNSNEQIVGIIDFSSFFYLSGNVVDCNFEPIKDGVAVLNFTGAENFQQIARTVNGKFEFRLPECGSTDSVFYELQAIDFESMTESEIVLYDFEDSGLLKLISMCKDLPPNGSFKIEFENGEEYELNNLRTVVQIDVPNEFESYDIIALDQNPITGDTIQYLLNFVVDPFWISTDSELVNLNGEDFTGENPNLYQMKAIDPLGVYLSYHLTENFVFGLWIEVEILQWDSSVETFSINRGPGKVKFISPLND